MNELQLLKELKNKYIYILYIIVLLLICKQPFKIEIIYI